RLGHAELVDAVVQRADVLLDRRLLYALEHLGAQRPDEEQVLAVVALGEREVGDVREDGAARRLARGRVAEANPDRLAFARHPAVPDVLLAQLAAYVRREVLDALEACRGHVDLQEEMHAAAQ